jgi:hypothetical protein
VKDLHLPVKGKVQVLRVAQDDRPTHLDAVPDP